MKKIILFVLLFPFVIMAQEMDSRGYIVKVGDAAPLFEFSDLDGNSYTNESLKGKVSVLQFTASWCSVCRKEMPHLEKEVWQKFKDDDFLLLGLDLKEDETIVRDFAEKMGVTYPMVSDIDGSLFAKFAGPKQGVTRNIVIDKNGEIVFLTRLYDRDEFEEMIRVIHRELNK